jgi:tetratricopeptide (TPR) repeat protein
VYSGHNSFHRKDNKMHITATIFGGLLLVSCLPNALSAQTASSPAATPPSSAKQSPAMGASFSLLSSPFLSPAAVARLQSEQRREDEAYALVKSGDEAAKVGDWTVAQNSYQQALEVSPAYGLGYHLSLYGLIAYCRATGDTTKGLEYSRLAIYHHGSAAEGFFENDTARLMQYALLLNKTGQSAEAMSAYNRAAHLLDYEDSQYHGGQPTLKVLLPEVAIEPNSPEQVQYTPERLQALADTALAHEEMGLEHSKEAIAHAREAVTLYPTSAVTHYYLGEAFPSRTPEQKAAYQKAAELGDERTAAAAKERLAVLR